MSSVFSFPLKNVPLEFNRFPAHSDPPWLTLRAYGNGYLEQAVSAYGYVAVMVGAFFEGETVFLLGQIAARHGLLNPWLVALAALSAVF